MSGQIVKTDTIVHERDRKGNIIRTEIIPAGGALPEWASEVGDHVFMTVEDVEVTEPDDGSGDGAGSSDGGAGDPGAGQGNPDSSGQVPPPGA